jgi:hypothetical protein
MFVMNGSLPEKLELLEQQFSTDLPHKSKRSEKKIVKIHVQHCF